MIYLNKYLSMHDRTIHTQFLSLTNISRDDHHMKIKYQEKEMYGCVVNDAGQPPLVSLAAESLDQFRYRRTPTRCRCIQSCLLIQTSSPHMSQRNQ